VGTSEPASIAGAAWRADGFGAPRLGSEEAEGAAPSPSPDEGEATGAASGPESDVASAPKDIFDDGLGNLDECRVCRGGAEPGRPLYSPCLCSGSIKHCHQDCLGASKSRFHQRFLLY
jgi:hypothetical protein